MACASEFSPEIISMSAPDDHENRKKNAQRGVQDLKSVSILQVDRRILCTVISEWIIFVLLGNDTFCTDKKAGFVP